MISRPSSRVVIIHGPPASGKLTVAKGLLQQLHGERCDGSRPACLLHNHLTFNVARTLFEIDDPRLNALHRALRLTMLEHALNAPFRTIVLTLVYQVPDSVRNVADILALVGRYRAKVQGYYLACPRSVLLSRVTEPDREAAGKLRSADKLGLLLDEHAYPPVPGIGTLEIDNGHTGPEATVAAILAHLDSS